MRCLLWQRITGRRGRADGEMAWLCVAVGVFFRVARVAQARRRARRLRMRSQARAGATVGGVIGSPR